MPETVQPQLKTRESEQDGKQAGMEDEEDEERKQEV